MEIVTRIVLTDNAIGKYTKEVLLNLFFRFIGQIMLNHFKRFVFFFVIFFLGNVFFGVEVTINIVKSGVLSLLTVIFISVFSSRWWKKNILKVKVDK